MVRFDLYCNAFRCCLARHMFIAYEPFAEKMLVYGFYDTKARFHVAVITPINESVVYFNVRRNVQFWRSEY